MGDKSIDALTRAAQLNDDDLLVLQQQGEAKGMPGSVLKQYAIQSVEAKTEEAAGYASDAAAEVEKAKAEVERAKYIADSLDMNALLTLIDQKGDNLEFDPDEEKLYLVSNGVRISDGITIVTSGGGSGGGGVTNNAVMTLTKPLDANWSYKSVAIGASCPVVIEWSSLESEAPTGPGVLRIVANGSQKHIAAVEQGRVPVDVGPYLTAGTNKIEVWVADTYGNERVLKYTVSAVALSLASKFDNSGTHTGAINYIYTPTGAAVKTVHFKVDDTELPTATVTESGRQQTQVIPAQSHGSHTLEVWFTALIDGVEIPSNTLFYDLICLEEGNTTPIIACDFRAESVEQFDTVNISYRVYDPSSLTASVVLDGPDLAEPKELTVDRTVQPWSYRADTAAVQLLTITCGDTVKRISLTVTESTINVEAVTDSLALHLSSYGRSNNEANPAQWVSGDVEAEFNGFNFVSDGWITDADGITALRVTGDARLTIPYHIFKNDFRSTGKTIEVEFASRNVLDYDAVILSCMSGNRGLTVTAQQAFLFSLKKSIGTRYKEDEHVRLSFVVEKKGENHLMLCYINGILSGVVQYPDDDDFSQGTSVGISIGSNDCTIDLYNIRVYDNDLTRHQILDNWIADTQSGIEKRDRYVRNNVYDEYSQIVIDNLPQDLPYIVVEATSLPAFKDDAKPCSGYYVDPADNTKNFRFENAEIDIQGTSSKDYYVKNWKIKFKGGFTLANGTTAEAYQLNSEVIPTDTYTFKADVASSEGANNVVLAKLYNDLCPVKTPPQEEDPRVRQTIDGHPIVFFFDMGDGPKFAGKYNFNHDKGTEEVFGFQTGDESWEIRENGTSRVGFKSADYSDNSWTNEFEARFPKDNTDISKFAEFAAWVNSTYTEQATGNALTEAVTYDGVTHTNDTAEYRLAKFKHELPDHANVDALVFYYLFTLIFLCIDQREKNAFPTFFDEMGKWLVFFYDADSSIGTDNKGNLAFDYWLEDIDFTEAGDPVFNGQGSVLWSNLRATYWDEIKAEYVRLRNTDIAGGGKLLSYETVNAAFEEHQSKWPEAIFNEDGFKKYIEPYELEGATIYFPMAQGKKEQFFKWWTYNRIRYTDSMFSTGTSSSKRIMLRAHEKANITLTSYVNMYGHVFFNDAFDKHRMFRGVPQEFVWPADGAEDPVININDADMLTDIGDLSPLMIELIDAHLATHLTRLKLGDAAEGYVNDNLNSVTVGNNTLLTSFDARNCVKLATDIDLSGCINIEEVYLDGTAVTSCKLPNGGNLKTLHLPGTVKGLRLQNQKNLTDFVLPADSYSGIESLRLENNSDAVPTKAILDSLAANSLVRIIGFDWTFDSASDILAFYDRLDTMRGLDENHGNVDKPQMSGTIRVDMLYGSELTEMQSRYPDIKIVYNSLACTVTYVNWDGTVLHTVQCRNGDAAIDPVATGAIEAPTKEATDDATYTYAGWDNLPDNIQGDTTITAVYTIMWAVRFYNGDTMLNAQWVENGLDAVDPVTANYISAPTKASTAQYTYAFSGWSDYTNITAARVVQAQFTSTVRTYTVRFYNGSTLLQTVNDVPYGGSATYTGSTPAYTGDNAEDYEFSGFSPDGKNITGATDCYAKFRYTGNASVSLVERTISGDYVNETVTSVGAYAFCHCTELTSLSLPEVTSIGDHAIQACTGMTSANIRKAESIGTYAFESCVALSEADFPVATSVGTYAFYNCTALTTADFSAAVSLQAYAFQGCRALTKLILRYTGGVCSLGSNALKSSAIASSTGYIYVPAALVDSYKENSSWSAYANQIRAIEDYPELVYKWSWEGVLARIDNGTYATEYAIGDTIPLDLGNEGVVNMQIAAFDADDLADGSGKAKITWISKELLATSHRMNPALVGLTTSYAFAADTATGENVWASTNQSMGSTTCNGDWTVTIATAGTLKVRYKVGSESIYDKLTVTVDGTTVASAISGTVDWTEHEVSCTAGQVVRVTAAYSKDSSGDQNGDTAYVDFQSDSALTIVQNAVGGTTPATEGTGSIGGWEKCEMRSYLQDTIKPLIAENVASRIATVIKTQDAYDTAGAKFTQTTQDDVWLPNDTEVSSSGIYTGLFSSSDARVKKKASSTSAGNWWLRRAYSTGNFYYVSTSGSNSSNSLASNAYDIALGFCLN